MACLSTDFGLKDLSVHCVDDCKLLYGPFVHLKKL